MVYPGKINFVEKCLIYSLLFLSQDNNYKKL